MYRARKDGPHLLVSAFASDISISKANALCRQGAHPWDHGHGHGHHDEGHH